MNLELIIWKVLTLIREECLEIKIDQKFRKSNINRFLLFYYRNN